MHSGVGDEDQLRKYGIPPVQHLPGVGQNFQDHLLICGCIWEYDQPVEMESLEAQSFFFWKSESHLDTPDLQVVMLEGALDERGDVEVRSPAEFVDGLSGCRQAQESRSAPADGIFSD